jgi:hypothetical protein
MTRLIQCKCKNAFQDATYGAGVRVHNRLTKKGKVGDQEAYACTVCGAYHR